MAMAWNQFSSLQFPRLFSDTATSMVSPMPTSSIPVFSHENKFSCHSTAHSTSYMPGFSGKAHASVLKVHSCSVATVENVECNTDIFEKQIPPALETTMPRDALLRNEKAQIIVAAEEVMALAKAAVKAAKDAAALAGQDLSVSEDMDALSLGSQFQSLKRLSSPEIESFTAIKPNLESQQISDQLKQLPESLHSSHYGIPAAVDSNFLQITLPNYLSSMELVENAEQIAVKSTRQLERQAKRERTSQKTFEDSSSISRAKTHRRASSRQRLLTASEEAILSRGVQDLLNLERVKAAYKEKLGQEPSMIQWAEAVGVDRFTLRKRLEEGYRSRNKFVNCNFRLVVSIAQKYQNLGLSLPDLVQAGCVGLIRGVEKFDATRGCKFSTYAHWWIRQSIKRTLTQRAKTVSSPASVVEAASQIRDAKDLFQERHHRSPKLSDIAEMTGLTETRVGDVMRQSKHIISLDTPLGDEDNSYLANVVSDPDQVSAETEVIAEYGGKEVKKMLRILTPKERELVRLRYGLADGMCRTLQEVGEIFSLSRERVRQMERVAMKKLRQNRNLESLEHYLNVEE